MRESKIVKERESRKVGDCEKEIEIVRESKRVRH